MTTKIKTWQERLPQDHVPTQMDRNQARDAEIAELRAALAASGGNAAPENAIPEITEVTDVASRQLIDFIYEQIGVTDLDQLIGHVQRIIYGCMNKSYSAGVKNAAASAPNAALVALKEACDLIRLEVADGVHTEEYRRGMAALSAAGQEVGK